MCVLLFSSNIYYDLTVWAREAAKVFRSPLPNVREGIIP